MKFSKSGFKNRLIACIFLSLYSLPASSSVTDAPSSQPLKNLCDGLISHRLPVTLTPLKKPALREDFIDPVFGSIIKRITDVGSKVSGDQAIIKPLYNTVQAWNADETRLILWQRGVGHWLYDGHSYQAIRQLDDIKPVDIEQIFWDTKDPDIFYYLGFNDPKPRDRTLIRYQVSQSKKNILIDLNHQCPVNHQATAGNDVQMMSWDSDKIGFRCGKEPSQFFTYQISTKKLRVFQSKKFQPWYAPQPTPSGSALYMQGVILSPQFDLLRQLDMANPMEHASLGKLPTGADAYFSVAFKAGQHCGTGSLIAHNIETGQCQDIIGPATGFPYPPSGTHVSAIAYKNPGWVALSSVGHTSVKKALDQEIYLAYAEHDNPIVCRVAHHRSHARKGRFGYWGEPHVVLSPSGTRLLFASDWQNSDSVETFVVELPAYRNKQ